MMDPTKMYNQFTPESLDKLSPNVPWTQYLRSRFPAESFPDVISKSTLLIVDVPTFHANLSSIVSANSAETLENYILWNYVWNYASYTAKTVKDLMNPLKEKTGQRAQVEPPRYIPSVIFRNICSVELN